MSETKTGYSLEETTPGAWWLLRPNGVRWAQVYSFADATDLLAVMTAQAQLVVALTEARRVWGPTPDDTPFSKTAAFVDAALKAAGYDAT